MPERSPSFLFTNLQNVYRDCSNAIFFLHGRHRIEHRILDPTTEQKSKNKLRSILGSIICSRSIEVLHRNAC